MRDFHDLSRLCDSQAAKKSQLDHLTLLRIDLCQSFWRNLKGTAYSEAVVSLSLPLIVWYNAAGGIPPPAALCLSKHVQWT